MTNEEMARKYLKDSTDYYDPREPLTERKMLQMCMDCIELGYSKANEWHKQKVDDIYDLISKDWSIRYFICIMKDKSRVTAIGNCDEDCNGGVSVNLVFEYDDEKYYLDDIVWWKEIVLPSGVMNEKETD